MTDAAYTVAGVALGVLGTAAAFSWTAGRQLARVAAILEQLEGRVERLEAKVDRVPGLA